MLVLVLVGVKILEIIFVDVGNDLLTYVIIITSIYHHHHPYLYLYDNHLGKKKKHGPQMNRRIERN